MVCAEIVEYADAHRDAGRWKDADVLQKLVTETLADDGLDAQQIFRRRTGNVTPITFRITTLSDNVIAIPRDATNNVQLYRPTVVPVRASRP
jgi:hypothetical protein